MKTWTRTEREAAYSALCEAVTASGSKGETLFLARLSLLLMEELADAAAVNRLLSEAALSAAFPTPKSTKT